MNLPPHGLCLACTITRVLDGDTVEIAVGSERRYKIRLLDCWAPEIDTAEGKAAKAFAEEVVDAADSTHVFIPSSDKQNVLGALLTFDRILGHIFVSSHETLSERVVAAGHATREKE